MIYSVVLIPILWAGVFLWLFFTQSHEVHRPLTEEEIYWRKVQIAVNLASAQMIDLASAMAIVTHATDAASEKLKEFGELLKYEGEPDGT